MFTGLIETTGRVTGTGAVFQVETAVEMKLNPGDSLCVNGSCLTVTKSSGRKVSFDVSPETFRRIVAPLRGEVVNLERSLAADGRLHGHFVTGHVDCTGMVRRVIRYSDFIEITVGYPPEHSCLLVEKGSVAVSGISLTVSALTDREFTVALIPETIKNTSAGGWKPGTKVNLEFDIIGKYVVRAAAGTRSEGSLRKYLENHKS